LDYRYTIYSLLALTSAVALMANWLHQRYCFRHKVHRVELPDGTFACPHCHQNNLTTH